MGSVHEVARRVLPTPQPRGRARSHP